MKKNIVFLIIIGVLLIGGIFYFFMQNKISEVSSSNNEQNNLPENPSSNNGQDNTSKTNISGPQSNIQTYNIEIKGFAFSPSTLTINIGDIVIWTNKDSVSHTVTSDSGNELNSPTFGKDGTYSHTFNIAGTFDYHCKPHSLMKGKIIVK